MVDYLAPSWFYGYEIAIDIISVVIALAVSMVAFKIYHLTGQKQPRLFGYAFILIALSYLLQFIIVEIFVLELQKAIETGFFAASVLGFSVAGIYLYMAFFIAGLLTLAYMTMNLKNTRAYLLMLILAGVAVFLSASQVKMFFILSSILLGFIIYHYYIALLRNKHITNFLVFIAFLFFFAGSISFFFAENCLSCLIYGNVLEAIGSVLILINLMLVLRK